MKTRKFFFIIIPFIFIYVSAFSQESPHILVNKADKELILNKIKQEQWAGSIYKNIFDRVSPYVERHKTDPEWILSRYLMNRIPGKRYTKVYSDNSGSKLIRWTGDAPVPTVRVSTHLRTPTTPSGGTYRKPSVEDLVPYDTPRVMHLLNMETRQMEWIEPQALITDINGDINALALDAAIIYWLTDDQKYAVFAADILEQWAKGASYQEPIIGPGRTGFLDIQTLGDAAHRPLILAYDFVKPFMKQNGYDLHYYDTVFEKFASTLAFRGFWNNNWYAAESSTMVFASLSLENQKKRDYYLQFFLTKDTINGAYGQLALPSTVRNWLTPDGNWKEPGGYHNYPVSNLLISALAMEKNGYDIFRRFPALFKASYVMLKYSFPNLTTSAFGDTGRPSQSPELLEMGLVGAVKYNQPELPVMLASLRKLIDGGKYRRENSGFMGLLCYLPELPDIETTYSWPRSGTLDFAKYFLQRNGMDPEYGLMYGVQGASYNHNHCNGMAMELYGVGNVMAIDAGSGPNYEHPLHVNYFSQWAAHNTVVAAGASSSVPHSGSAGRKEIGEIELAAMEPMPEKDAVSPLYSFTDTRYFDKSTGTNEMRTMAIVRTSEKTGYYVDIYRSDNPVSNDYVYHNIGDSLSFLTGRREFLKTIPAQYPVTEKDYPGFRFFTDVRKLEKWSDNLIALFSVKDEQSKDIFMQLLVPGKAGRTYYQALSPRTHTTGRQYAGKDLPVFTMRDAGESKSKPFIVVLEPYREKNGYSVESISVDQSEDGSVFTALSVLNRDQSQQLILQSIDPEKSFTSPEWTFTGYFGIVNFTGNNIASLYLGQGKGISFKGYSIKSSDPKGSASIVKQGKNYLISCSHVTSVDLPLNGIKKATLLNGKTKTKLKVNVSKKGISLSIPKVNDAILTLE